MPAPTLVAGGQTGGGSNYGGHDTAVDCTITLALTVPVTTNFLIVNMTATFDTAGTTEPPTFNGVAMTLFSQNATTGRDRHAIYYLVNPPIGTFNYVQGFGSAKNWQICIQPACFKDVNPLDPTDTYVTGSTSGSPYTTSITSDVKKYVYVAMQFHDRLANQGATSVSAPATHFGYQRGTFNDNTGSPQGAFAAAAGTPGLAGTTSIVWNLVTVYGAYTAINLNGNFPLARSQAICIF